MEKYCGKLERVGDLTGGGMIVPTDEQGREKLVGRVRVATELSAIQIGDKVIKKPRCEDDLFEHLHPGRDACIYIFRHMHWTPVLLGIKYSDGSKHMVTSSYLRGTIIQYIILWPIMLVIPGAIVGGMLFGPFGAAEVGGGIGFSAGVGYAWWSAFRVWKDHGDAKKD
ncbi:MAG TPA: hypothetical protein VH681_15145 [Nitrospiraceae bacterium]